MYTKCACVCLCFCLYLHQCHGSVCVAFPRTLTVPCAAAEAVGQAAAGAAGRAWVFVPFGGLVGI
jgi:hypothetical protein